MASALGPGIRNGIFANRVHGFVKRVGALPGMPALPVTGAAAALLMSVVGGFGTGAMPAGQRLAFWLLLIGWNTMKWQAWFTWRVRVPADWRRAALLGIVPLNLTLPLEIGAALAIFGLTGSGPVWRTWFEAGAISAAILVVILVLVRHIPRAGATAVEAALPAITVDGVLNRAGISAPAQLAAITAEDHYCRLHLTDGRSRLVHARFGDALADAARLDGGRVHRGAWVAGHAVRGARRVGRRWRLLLTSAPEIAISAQFVADARARGWLRPPL